MELTIKGQTYATQRLDTFIAFHVGRRLMPAYFALGATAAKLLNDASDGLPLEAMGPVVDVMAAMSNADSQFIIDQCLAVVSRQSGAGWQKITAANGNLIFDDIKLQVMLQLVTTVIKENLDDFFPDAQTEE